MQVAGVLTTAGQAISTAPSRTAMLIRLIEFFHREEIGYCIVGDTRALPYQIGGDIDFVVEKTAFRTLSQKLALFCDEEDALLVQSIQHEPEAFHFAITWKDASGERQYLNPDVCTDFIRYGRFFLSADSFLQDRVLKSDMHGNCRFYVPQPRQAFIYYLIKKVDKGELGDQHGEYLSEQWRQDPTGCRNLLRIFWPSPHAEAIEEAAKNNDWRAVQSNLKTYQTILHLACPSSAASRHREFYRKVRRVLHPTGLFVVFLGPDGSGKSSVIDALVPRLSLAFISRSARWHLRPDLDRRKAAEQGKVHPDPHGKPPRNAIASVLKLFYYLLDYVLGYVLKVRPQLVRSTLVLFDRYYDDLLVDPRRYRYGGPRWLLRAVRLLVPKPDLIFLLDASPDVLQSRKREVAYEETTRQQRAYLDMILRMPKGYVLDASRPLEEVVTAAEDVILNFMANRTLRRLGLS